MTFAKSARLLLVLLGSQAAFTTASAQALDQVDCQTGMTGTRTLNALDLFAAAGACIRDQRQLEGSYLLIVGQLRASSDLGFLRPSSEEDEQKAAELYGFMYYRAAGPGSEEIYRHEQLTDRLFALIRAWKPELPENYDPGWAYRRGPDEKKYFESLAYDCEVRLMQLGRHAQLLRDETYYAAYVEDREIWRRTTGAMKTGTPDYERHVQLNAIMTSVSERYPDPEYPEAPTQEFTLDPEADFRQIYTGFDGQDNNDTTIAWTREEAEQSWLAQAMTEVELSMLLSQVDFAHEMVLIHSIGKRMNVTGALHVSDVDVRQEDSSVSVTVRIGVNERGCEWPGAEAYPFVVAVTRKTPERASSSGYYHGNFGDGCKPPASGKPAPAVLKDLP